MSRIRAGLQSLGIVLVVTLISIKFFDLGVGAFSDASAGTNSATVSRAINLREFPPLSDQMLLPSDAYIDDVEGLPLKPYRLRTDENGFIVGEQDFTAEIKARRVDILFLGGSTTECLYVDESIRFPYLVSQRLGDVSNRPLRVLNAGFSGNHSLHSLLVLVSKGIAAKPRYAVMMHAINDTILLSKTLSYFVAPPGRRLIVNFAGEKGGGFMYDLLRSFKNLLVPNIWPRMQHLIAGQIDGKLAVDEWAEYRNSEVSVESVRASLDNNFAPSLKSFVRISRAWGIEPVLMTQFNRIRLDDSFVKRSYLKRQQAISYEDFARLYAHSNNIIREVARVEGVLLIDLDREIPANSKWLYDGVHVNANGSVAVADVIARSLARTYPHDFKVRPDQ